MADSILIVCDLVVKVIFNILIGMKVYYTPTNARQVYYY